MMSITPKEKKKIENKTKKKERKKRHKDDKRVIFIVDNMTVNT